MTENFESLFKHNNLILCNDIINIDDSIYSNFINEEEIGEDEEFYQWFLTDLNKDYAEYLVNKYKNIFITYSEKLDLYILAVNFFGVNWQEVEVEEK